MKKTYKITPINKNDIIKTDYFKIPKYQRNLVWSAKKKYELINSIIKGFPIGSILIHKENDGKYNIIDGLQRITTLKDYFRDPHKYLKKNDELTKLFEEQKLDEEQIEQFFKIIHKDNSTSNIEMNSNIMNFFTSINKKPIVSKLDQIMNEARAIMEDVEITAIEYQGDPKNLPLIFERLNSNGTQLSKFDIYAASWTNLTVKIENQDIKDKINERYRKMYQNSDIDIVFDENNFEYSVFDYGYGLGKHLSSKYKYLFSDKDNYDVPAHGFNILSLVLFGNVSSIGDLGIELSSKTETQITDIYSKIINVMEKVSAAINITSKNHLTNNALNPHTDYQLYSIIGYVFKKGKDLNTQFFNQYVWKHIYVDLIRNHWSGSGDSKVKTILESTKNIYESDIDYKNVEEIVKEYLSSENNTNNKGNISNLDRLTVSLLFKHSKVYSGSGNYDVEHIVPRGKFDENNNFPIGSVVNMTFMKAFDNRSKKDKTLWQEEKIIKENSDFFKLDKQKIIDEYYYPNNETLNFVNAGNITTTNYSNFLDLRTKIVKTKIMEFLKK